MAKSFENIAKQVPSGVWASRMQPILNTMAQDGDQDVKFYAKRAVNGAAGDDAMVED